MADSWRSRVCRTPKTGVSAVALGVLLAGGGRCEAAESLRIERPVQRLGTAAGYASIGHVTKPVLAAESTGRTEVALDDVPAGDLQLAAACAPDSPPVAGLVVCQVSVTGSGRRGIATLRLKGGSNTWSVASASFAATRGERLVMDCVGTGGIRPQVVWAQPLMIPGAHVSAAPLIVVISLDTLRADHVYGFGAPAGATPALERLGREGMLLTRTAAEATWTVPSHFSLFYGRLYGFPPTSPPVRGLAQLLADHGYVTAAFTGGGFVGAYFRFHLGFDHFAEYDSSRYGGSDVRMLPTELADARAWMDWFDGVPLFLFIHTYAVHEQTPEEADVAMDLGEWVPSPELIEKASVFYRQLVAETDFVLEPFLDRLRAEARRRPVLLVVLSDHGEAFGEHDNFRHGDEGPRVTLHDEILHVPLIVWGPSLVPAGAGSARPTMLSDVAPSILGAAGVPAASTMTGENLWPLWSGAADGAATDRRPSVSHGARGWALRSSSYKLIFEEPSDAPVHVELYALERDAHERRDLAVRHPRAVAALARRLSRRISSLTGAIALFGVPPVCPLCRWEQMPAFYDQTVSAPPPAAEPGVDAATRERLRALGYVDR